MIDIHGPHLKRNHTMQNQTYVKAHLDRGARLLEQEKKYSRDLLVHLTELDDSL